MALFKKRIAFPQFVANLISYQYDFLTGNLDKLIALADEMKALTKEDKEQFSHKAYALCMVNLSVGCLQHFSAYVSQKEIGQVVGCLYEKYLAEFKHLPKTEVDQKIADVMALFDFAGKAEKDEHERHGHYDDMGYTSYPKVDDPTRASQLHLCQGFAEYCVGNDVRADAHLPKRLAAFRLAMGLVIPDIVGNALKQCKVSF